MNQERDAAAVRFFPPGVPLLAIAAGYALNRFIPIEFGWVLSAPLRYWLGGSIALGSILLLGLWSVILFRKTGQDENPWKPTPAIETRGPYQITRNPMYLQMILVCFGVGLASMNWWTIGFAPLVGWILWLVAVKPEEEYLTQKFGETYQAYQAKVRRWL